MNFLYQFLCEPATAGQPAVQISVSAANFSAAEALLTAQRPELKPINMQRVTIDIA